MKNKLKDIMQSLTTVFFVIIAIVAVLVAAITVLAITFIDKLQKDLNDFLRLQNPIRSAPLAKSRPSILYMLEEGFFSIDLFITEEGKEVWSIKHYHGNNELYINKQPNKPFIIGYSDDVNSRIIIPDKYITKVNRCE